MFFHSGKEFSDVSCIDDPSRHRVRVGHCWNRWWPRLFDYLFEVVQPVPEKMQLEIVVERET